MLERIWIKYAVGKRVKELYDAKISSLSTNFQNFAFYKSLRSVTNMNRESMIYKRKVTGIFYLKGNISQILEDKITTEDRNKPVQRKVLSV